MRHTDFDFKDELKFSALLGLLQESAGFSADELGFGYDSLKDRNYAFIIVNTYCKIVRPVRLSEAVTVETWPLPPRHVIFERDYHASVKGETVALAASRWCLVRLDDFSLLTPDKLGKANDDCPYRAEKTAEVPSWKIPKLTGGREVSRIRIGNSQCDHYLHANNTRYADFFADCFTMEELFRSVSSFQIAYGKQAKEGTELVFYREDFGNRSVCEARCSGEVFTQFAIEFTGEEKA